MTDQLGAPGSEATTEGSLAVRQRASREEVLDAAAEAFLERGYAATSIDDVAERLRGTKGRVYHYFRTKGELFLGVHRRALDLAIEAVAPILDAEGTATERLHRMASAHARLMVEESSFMRLAAQHTEMGLALEGRTPERDLLEVFALRQRYEGYFERVISEGVRSGEFRPVNANLMAKAGLGALNWISVWFRPDARPRAGAGPAEITEEFATFVLAGLVANGVAAST
jgi:AcrR family transcriptional regulator